MPATACRRLGMNRQPHGRQALTDESMTPTASQCRRRPLAGRHRHRHRHDLVDPVLGTELVRVDATGLDLAAAFAFAREQGRAALRAMNSAQRAKMFAAVAKVLQAHAAASAPRCGLRTTRWVPTRWKWPAATAACKSVGPDVAALHTGHGTVMPQSLHGGPGRAGGGEELGGPRALNFYLHRAAVQASTTVLTQLN